MEQLISHIQKLTEMHGAPGSEHLVRNYLKAQLEPISDEVMQDGLGGIFFKKASKNKDAKTVLVAAHMDEVGFMVTDIKDNGLIQFTSMGGWPLDVLPAQNMKVLTQDNVELTGVISSIPAHFRTGKEAQAKIDELRLDIGAENKDHAVEMGVSVGDTIVPDVPFRKLTDNRYLCKAWDNRYGCVMIIDLMNELKDTELPFHLVVGANVQEEVGLRGAKVSTRMINPDVAYVVDCSPANDMQGSKEDNGRLGEGLLLRIIDREMILSPLFRNYMKDICETENIQYQSYVSLGGTDGGEIHVSGDGIPTAVVGVPGRYIHSNHTIFDMRDYEAAKTYLMKSLTTMDEAVIEKLKGK